MGTQAQTPQQVTDIADLDLVEGEEEAQNALEVLMGFAEAVVITEMVEDEELQEMGHVAQRGFNVDEQSIADWRQEVEDIRKVAQQYQDDKTYPWPGASNIKYPLMLTAALQFNARAYPTIVNNGLVAKATVHGEDEQGDKQSRAQRVSKHMSYQLIQEMDGWDADMDKLLLGLPIDGCEFKKVWYNSETGKNVSEYVQALDLVVNNSTKDLRSCPRVSNVLSYYPYEIKEKQAFGVWRTVDLSLVNEDDQEPEIFIEQHCLYDLDDDGYPEPYIVTFHKETGTVVRVAANYLLEDITATEDGEIVAVAKRNYFVKYECFPDPEGGFYGKGFGQLLKPINDSVDSILNQMIDSGHLANTGGGFLGKGFKVKSGSITFKPGEWKKTDSIGGALKDNIVPLPVREPSPVLFNLLGLLLEAGKEIASIQDVMTGGGGQNMPATSVLAMIEQGTKVYSAIFKRIYRSLKEELGLLYLLNGSYLDEQEYQNILDDPEATLADYENDSLDVTPEADPNMATDMQKMAKAQILQQSMGLPWVNGPEVTVETWKWAGITDPEKYLVPPPEGPSPEEMTNLAKLNIEERKMTETEKNGFTERLHRISLALEKVAITDTMQADNFLNSQELSIIASEFQQLRESLSNVNTQNEPASVPGLEAGAPVAMGAPGEVPAGAAGPTGPGGAVPR